MAHKRIINYRRQPDHDLDIQEVPQDCRSFEELFALIHRLQAAGRMDVIRIASCDPAQLQVPAVYRLARTKRDLAELENFLRPTMASAKRFYLSLHEAPFARSPTDQRAVKCLTVVWTAGNDNPAEYLSPINPES